MANVVFNATEFRELFPAFADEVRFTDTILMNAFVVAAQMIGTGDDSILPYNPEAVPPVLTRKVALDYLTCHILTMQHLWEADQAAPVTSASQGSVSVSFGGQPDPSDGAWYNRTKCGATAWQIIKAYAQGPIYYGVQHIYTGG